MARDEHDQETGELELDRRGRPAKYGKAMTAAQRKAAERERMKAKGYVQRQVWVKTDAPTRAAVLRDQLDQLSLDDVAGLSDQDLKALTGLLHHWHELAIAERDRRK